MYAGFQDWCLENCNSYPHHRSFTPLSPQRPLRSRRILAPQVQIPLLPPLEAIMILSTIHVVQVLLLRAVHIHFCRSSRPATPQDKKV